MIYFIHCEASKTVKIGVAGDPRKRLQELQVGCPDELCLLGFVPGSEVDEARFHKKYDHLSVRGEWFRETEELIQDILSLLGSQNLTPSPGTNPEGWPVPNDSLLDFFFESKVLFPELCYVTSMAVGHAVSIYQGLPSMIDAFVRGTDVDFKEKRRVYQVMKWSEKQDEFREFWWWHLWERPQWYPTPEKACAAYVASHRQWLKDHKTDLVFSAEQES